MFHPVHSSDSSEWISEDEVFNFLSSVGGGTPSEKSPFFAVRWTSMHSSKFSLSHVVFCFCRFLSSSFPQQSSEGRPCCIMAWCLFLRIKWSVSFILAHDAVFIHSCLFSSSTPCRSIWFWRSIASISAMSWHGHISDCPPSPIFGYGCLSVLLCASLKHVGCFLSRIADSAAR